MSKPTLKEIREAVEFLERLTLMKTNGGRSLSSGFEPIIRRPRESFINYAVRVRNEGFPGRPMLRRVRKRRWS